MNQCLQDLLDLITEQILINQNFISSHKKKIIIQVHEEILWLLQYAVNNTQAIIYLAKNDCSNNYSLVHSAFVIARVVMETNSKICWLLQPEHIDSRIARYINLLYKESKDIELLKITGVDQRIESREEYIQNLKSVILENKSFEVLDLQDLLKSNKLPKDFEIIESVYTDELSFFAG